jgi:peptide/nickel transport system permease protein
MRLARYLGIRILQMIPLVIAVVVVSFVILRLAPGDPAMILAGPTATPEYIEEVRRRYGLDQPVLAQFAEYVRLLLTGDLGTSYSIGQPVTAIIAARLPATLLLVVTSEVLGIVIGSVLGTIAARKQGRVTDRVISTTALAAASMPVFWLGMIFILVFAVTLRVLPSSGMYGPFIDRESFAGVLDLLTHLILPVVTLTLAWTLPTYLRLARAGVIEEAKEDYIRTARAKGASESRVYFGHALRNAALPLINVAGLNFGLAITGAILTETIFSWPGIGLALNQAISSRDYPLLIGIFIVASLGVALANLLTDVIVAIANPKAALA